MEETISDQREIMSHQEAAPKKQKGGLITMPFIIGTDMHSNIKMKSSCSEFFVITILDVSLNCRHGIVLFFL